MGHRPKPGIVLDFQQVPEPKHARNRLHLDVEVADLTGATAACVGLGAAAVGSVVRDEDRSFQVMVNP